MGISTGNSIPSGGHIYTSLANGIAQGSDVNQRIGNRIKVKKIEVVGNYGNAGAGLIGAALCWNLSQQATFSSVTDRVGVWPWKDNAIVYSYATVGQQGGSTAFRFQKTFPGLGKEVRFDKDAQVPLDHPTLLLTNDTAAASSGTAWNFRVWYTDI